MGWLLNVLDWEWHEWLIAAAGVGVLAYLACWAVSRFLDDPRGWID